MRGGRNECSRTLLNTIVPSKRTQQRCDRGTGNSFMVPKVSYDGAGKTRVAWYSLQVNMSQCLAFAHMCHDIWLFSEFASLLLLHALLSPGFSYGSSSTCLAALPSHRPSLSSADSYTNIELSFRCALIVRHIGHLTLSPRSGGVYCAITNSSASSA